MIAADRLLDLDMTARASRSPFIEPFLVGPILLVFSHQPRDIRLAVAALYKFALRRVWR